MHSKAIGDVDFTTEWQDFYTTLIVPAEADGMKSIGFYMAEIMDACDYYIKDVIWMTEDHSETLIDVEGTKNFYVKEGASDIIHEFGSEQAPKVYTEFVEATGTLTYYYDGKINFRSGVTELYDPEATRFAGYKNDVQMAVIDPSMKESPLTSTKNMFYELFNMESIDGLENLNTADVTDMKEMFYSCKRLTTLDLSTFDTRKVTDMEGMFENCSRLVMLDISSFDVSSVTNFMLMFSQCTHLKTICCFGDWSTSSAQSGYMFYGCRDLCGDKGTAYTDAVTDKTYARPDGGTASPGYFTAETMTGISLTPDPSPGRGEIYNLAGQKMVNGKLPRGLYIVGGRKVLR